MSISRRDLLALSALGVASASLEAATPSPSKGSSYPSIDFDAQLPKKKATRVVVVGGGWSGLSIAKNIRAYSPQAEVILVEQRSHFMSCPVSNLWLVDEVSLEYLTHDYFQAARSYGYTYFQATAIDVDKAKQILYTSNGKIAYDYLVLSPGIEYDYSKWTSDPVLEQRLRREYPAGFIPGSEHITLKNKLKNFKGGNFILTVPSGNYRCLPAPYERACIIAAYFRQKKIKGKVILLDANPDVTIKAAGFHSAFKEIHKEYIEYVPSAAITGIDLDAKVISTEFDEYEFADAALYPPVRGASILEKMGLARDAKNKQEAYIDELTYEAKGAKNIFIAGDARPMGFSKSGNTANTEGQYVASIVATHINNTPQLKWEPPTTLCFSVVDTKPSKAIYVLTQYSYDHASETFDFAGTVYDEDWHHTGAKNAASIIDWADSLYADMFGDSH